MAKLDKNKKRAQRTRYKLKAIANGRARLSIHRTPRHIYAQVIDDEKGTTVVAASSQTKALKLKATGNVDAAKKVGEAIAKAAKEKNIKSVVFDRGAFRYHGRVKALADAAREAGLEF